MYFSNTNLIKSVVLNTKQSRGAREVCYYYFFANSTAKDLGGNGVPVTFTFFQCEDYGSPTSVTLPGTTIGGANTSSMENPYCGSATRPKVDVPSGSLNNPNQFFYSPYPCQPEYQFTSSSGNFQYATFGRYNQMVTTPYTLASWIPSGSLSYVYQLVPSGSTLGPIAIESGSAFYSGGWLTPQGTEEQQQAITYSVYP
jgi:hypothetical protein